MSRTRRNRTRTRTRSFVRRAVLGTAAVAAGLVLAACGDGADSGPAPQASASASAGGRADDAFGPHNDQDVSFAQDMIPHHLQAVRMSGMAAERASSAEVRDLARRIEKAQAPEIETMSGWLEAWGEDVPASMPGMDHGADSGMPGMMDADDLDELTGASGKGFDAMFLTMMIEHHEGAVEMAATEKEQGRYGPATALADDIVTTQTAEIEEMNKLLGKS